MFESGPGQAAGTQDFRPGPYGKTAVKDKRIIAELRDDRRIARDVSARPFAPAAVAERGRFPAPAKWRSQGKTCWPTCRAGPLRISPLSLGWRRMHHNTCDQSAQAVPQHEDGLSCRSPHDAVEATVEIVDVLIE